MRAKLTLLSLLMFCILSSAAFAQTHSVSKAEALTIAQRQFQGRDVDYLILQDNSQTAWTIFVDAKMRCYCQYHISNSTSLYL